jgi:putative hemolysin
MTVPHIAIPDMGTLLVMAAIVLLLGCSALMSASEVALFSLTPVQLRDLRERGGARGKRVLDLLAKPRRLLATILISNNLANVGIVMLSTILVDGLVDVGRMPAYLVFLVQVIAVTAVILLLGEVLPKVYATTHARRTAELMAPPLSALQWFWGPLNKVLLRSSNFLEKRYKRRSTQGLDANDLGHALDLTQDASTTPEEKKILRGIVKFGDLEARQIMRPRTDMIAFDKELDFQQLLTAIIDSGFSRVPVFERTLDKVVGVLHIKDVLPHIEKAELNWQHLLREPYFVPENVKLSDLLVDFRSKKVHLAVVVDEYGGTSGIVTLEDVIEEIVGDITDEFDDEDVVYSKLDDHTWVFEGKTPLNDLYRVLGIEGREFEESKGESETLGGFVLELAGRIPQKGERTVWRNFSFTVEASDNKRVRRVKVIMNEEMRA